MMTHGSHILCRKLLYDRQINGGLVHSIRFTDIIVMITESGKHI